MDRGAWWATVHVSAKSQTRLSDFNFTFLNDQCKEIVGNNRMGKTRDLFKKSRDTKGTFHAKMGSIKYRNGMDLIFLKRALVFPILLFSSISLH